MPRASLTAESSDSAGIKDRISYHSEATQLYSHGFMSKNHLDQLISFSNAVFYQCAVQ